MSQAFNVYSSEFIEADASPLATQTLQFFSELQAEKSSDFWTTFCELNASEPECKVYEV